MERHFYHSFPRIRPDYKKEDILKDGMNILNSIFNSGLMLAPEIVEWKQPLIDGTFRITKNRQLRISFTELAESEIIEHGKRFGPFSLEFKIDDFRKLGALPVIYMPQHLKEDRDLSSIGSTIVTTIGDIKYTIAQLNQLSISSSLDYHKLSNPEVKSISPDAVFNLQNTNPENDVVQSFQVPFKSITDLLSFIGFRNAPFDLMIGVLSSIQNLFYPTDDQINDSMLSYYRQREWRLISGVAFEGKAQTRLLNTIEKEKLLNINPVFWNKELNDGNVVLKRIDEAVVIETFGNKHISELISVVRVPVDVYEEAERLFGDKVIIVKVE